MIQLPTETPLQRQMMPLPTETADQRQMMYLPAGIEVQRQMMHLRMEALDVRQMMLLSREAVDVRQMMYLVPEQGAVSFSPTTASDRQKMYLPAARPTTESSYDLSKLREESNIPEHSHLHIAVGENLCE